ncbi:MAG: ribonuclease R [Streptococcaceae bacterium]|nr:ribonuclease R [Streptococcaceae bacterium]
MKKVKKNGYQISMTGTYHQKAEGFGFVSLDDSDEADVFIADGQTSFAFDGDQVEVQITQNAHPLKNTAAQGKIIAILEHGLKTLTGVFKDGIVHSRTHDLSVVMIDNQEELQLENGDIVRVDLVHYPSSTSPLLEGKILEILGKETDKGIDVLEILSSLGIESKFPNQVIDQVEFIPEEISINNHKDRIDYRDQLIFTIDGADAKDLDDAVHIQQLDNGHIELGVHIADVSHYVEEDSALDNEAFERGTSVYVTDRVVPMLPQKLSNGLCSLQPKVDRLTQSCVMEIDWQGEIIDYRMVQSIIRSVERLTYDEVNHILEGENQAIKKYNLIVEPLLLMEKLHESLAKMRTKRGSIDFDNDEAKIQVNERGFAIDVEKRQRGTAERMIESFMLIANETVARHFEERNLPFLYRIHQEPKPAQLEEFVNIASSFDIQVDKKSLAYSQKAFQHILETIKGRPEESILSALLLHSMQQARYSEKNLGHYGLAADAYTHFTSPIRRYPDLIVHRLIRELSNSSSDKLKAWQEKLPKIAHQSSEREQRAVTAERKVEKMKKAEYISAYIGQEFAGIISGITKFGLFIQLENTIEGLIDIASLRDDYYVYDRRMNQLMGQKTGNTFKLGQPIRVKVIEADKFSGHIDFEYLSDNFDRIDK